MTWRKLLARSAEVALALSALTVVGVLIQREGLRRLRPEPGDSARPVANWERYLPQDRLMGSPTARVKLVVFTDFQCSTCALVHSQLLELQRAHGPDLAVAYRHYPSSLHSNAVTAAAAAECAAGQGRFEAFSDLLFARQYWIGINEWDEFRKTALVPDSVTFDQCMRDRSGMRRVKSDVLLARELGVTSAPALLLDGVLLTGSSVGEWRDRVRRMLDRAEAYR